jgi:hypothetical protein
MAKRTWFAGRSISGEPPVWAPLLAVVGALTSGFMWMYEVVLDDGRSLHAYKHHDTRRYLHLDTQRNAWAYQHRQGRSMYHKADLADALTEAFADWDGLAFGPTAEERALIAKVIGAARHGAPQPRTTTLETVTVEIDAVLMERARARVPSERGRTDRATAEHALVLYALDRELLHGDYPGRLTDADASCLLSDELRQTGRVHQNSIQQGVTADD